MNDDLILEKIAIYQTLVKQYELIDHHIDQLIMKYGGASINMTELALQQYRQLADQRTALLNEMRVLEEELL